uniref:Uncharacterized protein n=1 Tax=Setaria italica TaxID=4555 RepID=K3YXG7_SETIT
MIGWPTPKAASPPVDRSPSSRRADPETANSISTAINSGRTNDLLIDMAILSNWCSFSSLPARLAQ